MKSSTLAAGLYTVGIVVAISTAAKVPAQGASTPDTLPYYGLAVVISLAGLVWWRRNLSRTRADQAEGGEGPRALLRHLENAAKGLDALGGKIDDLDSHEICQYLDEILLKDLMAFSDGRQTLIDQLGMREAAEIILKAAFVERYLNRCWSAASDQHLPEAKASFQRAHGAIHELVDATASI